VGFLRAWIRGNAFLDHLKPFGRLFSATAIQNVIEFGLGDGTRFFLEHAAQVKSVEIVTQRSAADGTKWFAKCREQYRAFPNWHPVFMVCDDFLEAADRCAIERRLYPATIDDRYLKSLSGIVSDVIKDASYDLGFVDYGLHIRGDLVNCLFGRTRIIVAHDTNSPAEIYGRDKIIDHPDYVKVRYSKGQGTTFWFHRDRMQLAEVI